MTYYQIPPSDERYLRLTDADILFDFYSVQEMNKKEGKAAPIPETPAPVAPMPPGADARQTSWAVQADVDEFRDWCRKHAVTI